MIFPTSPMILQYPDATANRASLQAVIKLPELSPREEVAVRAVSDLLMESTTEYSKAQIMRWGGLSGIRPSVEMMPGFVRLSISTPPEQIVTGISILESVIRRPSFSDQDLNDWKLKSRTSATDYWQTALWPQSPVVSDLRKSDLREAFVRYFRPENVTIALGGNYTSDIPEKLTARFENWLMPRATSVPTDLNRRKNTLSNATGISTVEFSGKEIRLTDADFPSKLLAIFAMGVGKGSTIFQVPRELFGVSYRQELLLWPTPKGFRTRLILAISDPDFTPQRSSEIFDAMLKSIGSWTEESRTRAIGAAEGLLLYGIGISPFAVTGQATIGESLERETLMRAFWFSTSGREWDPQSYLSSMKLVEISALKEAGQTILTQSETRVILGLKGRS